jgi:hypothetical protein
MATKIKITESFTVTAGNGESYLIEEHTRCSTTKRAGVVHEQIGGIWLKTNDGRGVLKNDDNTYSIPSLGVKAVR